MHASLSGEHSRSVALHAEVPQRAVFRRHAAGPRALRSVSPATTGVACRPTSPLRGLISWSMPCFRSTMAIGSRNSGFDERSAHRMRHDSGTQGSIVEDHVRRRPSCDNGMNDGLGLEARRVRASELFMDAAARDCDVGRRHTRPCCLRAVATRARWMGLASLPTPFFGRPTTSTGDSLSAG